MATQRKTGSEHGVSAGNGATECVPTVLACPDGEDGGGLGCSPARELGSEEICRGIPWTWRSYSWEERESIAYWWTLLSVFDASAPPVFAEAFIKTYEVHEEDPVRRCFFSVTRDEQNHEQMCGLAITRFLDHPDPLTYEPKTDLGRRLQKNAKWLYYNGGPLLDGL